MPIILLTGRVDDTDRTLVLEMGVDDYLGKTSNSRELLGCLHAAYCRSNVTSGTPTHTLHINNIDIPTNKDFITIDPESHNKRKSTLFEDLINLYSTTYL